jgi:hypothetical protein
MLRHIMAGGQLLPRHTFNIEASRSGLWKEPPRDKKQKGRRPRPFVS